MENKTAEPTIQTFQRLKPFMNGCHSCKHWDEAPGQEGAKGGPTYGLCRRFPPTMALRAVFLVPPHPNAGRPQVGPDGQPFMQPIPLWPVTEKNEKCGEHSRQ